MRTIIKGAAVVLAMLFVAFPLAAQDSARPYRSDDARGAAGANGAHSQPFTSGFATAGVSQPAIPDVVTTSGTPTYTTSGDPVYLSTLQGTSFNSYNIYFNSLNYYSYLSRYYSMNPLYFNRFYRNTEPLVTPSMLKLTLAEPLRLSSQMLVAIDQLETLLQDVPSGKPVDKNELIAKSRQIQQLAKQIRQNQTISYIELRKDKAVYQEENGFAVLSPESLGKLREMATDLNRQLKTLYQQSSTSTVSVSHFNEASLESLTRGIEKLSKAIQNSSKRM
jgi:hypothetical protein